MPEQDDSPAPSRFYPISPKFNDEILKRFTYQRPQPDQLPRYTEIRSQAFDLALTIARTTPPSREQALALTKLEEAVMHANSAIAREPRPAEKSDDLADVKTPFAAAIKTPTPPTQGDLGEGTDKEFAEATKSPTPPDQLAPVGG